MDYREITMPPEQSPIETQIGAAVKHWILLCLENTAFVQEYDRLHGTNIRGSGTPLELLIDESTSRTNTELREFFDFCVEVLMRMPDEAVAELFAMSQEP